jgi:hypothetical protein
LDEVGRENQLLQDQLRGEKKKRGKLEEKVKELEMELEDACKRLGVVNGKLLDATGKMVVMEQEQRRRHELAQNDLQRELTEAAWRRESELREDLKEVQTELERERGKRERREKTLREKEREITFLKGELAEKTVSFQEGKERVGKVLHYASGTVEAARELSTVYGATPSPAARRRGSSAGTGNNNSSSSSNSVHQQEQHRHHHHHHGSPVPSPSGGSFVTPPPSNTQALRPGHHLSHTGGTSLPADGSSVFVNVSGRWSGHSSYSTPPSSHSHGSSSSSSSSSYEAVIDSVTRRPPSSSNTPSSSYTSSSSDSSSSSRRSSNSSSRYMSSNTSSGRRL